MSTSNDFVNVNKELKAFQIEFSNSIKQVLAELDFLKKKASFSEQWLDNNDVSKLLNLTTRTLQNYRDNGIFSFSLVGGKIFYKASDIEKVLEKNYNGTKN